MTRDRKELTAEWNGVPFSIMDTGGWLAAGDALEAKVSDQAERALAEADVILMVVDVTTGVTEEDLAAAKVIRRAGPPVRLVVNKVDGASRDTAVWDFVSLGLGDPYPVRSLHGRGTGDLLDEVVALLPEPLPEDAEDRARPSGGRDSARGDRDPGTPSVAIIGRPNVGKSTLFNKLLGEERAIVHDMPGMTADAIDTVVETPDGPVRFIDTAGLRRPSKTELGGTEQHATMRALRALERADVAVLVIDATIGASHQDQRLAERIGVSGCPAIVALNKWDQVAVDDRDEVLAGVGDRLAFLARHPCSRCRPCRERASTGSFPRCATASPPTTSGCRREPSTAPCRSCSSARLRPGTKSATSSRVRSIPRRSRCSRMAGSLRHTCATSSAASGRSSTSARRR